MDDLTQKLLQKIESSQALLLKLQDSTCSITHMEILKELNDILDNGVLAALKKRADIGHLLEVYEQNASTGMNLGVPNQLPKDTMNYGGIP